MRRVCIVGVGYVGENLVSAFMERNNVTGYDISEKRIADLKLKYQGSNVHLQTTSDGIEECGLFCIAIPTPIKDVDGSMLVDLTFVEKACETVASKARPGAVVVMESSVSIGTTRRLLSKLRERGIYVGFSPERVDPGRVDPPAHKIPKIVSGIDPESLEAVRSWYKTAFDSVVPVSSMETAEMCKLYENCFRMVNIAYVNEIADACAKHGIDPHEMISASATKPFGFMPFWPGLGVGGSCIPINPYYLFQNNRLPLLEAATNMTRARPVHKADELVAAYPTAHRILVVGLGFKPGQSLTLHSPSIPFVEELLLKGKRVWVYDPLVRDSSYETLDESRWNEEYLDANIDLVCVACRQHLVDFSVLGRLSSSKVVTLCK